MSASLDTLFLPLQSGAVPPTGRTLFIGAVFHPYLAQLKPDCWQPFKPLAHGLPNLLGEIPTGGYDLALVNIPKQVDEAKFWIASALSALKPDGWLVMAAANDANGNRLEKWCKELGLSCDSDSKNKARVVWTKRPATLLPLVSDWLTQGQKKTVIIGTEKFIAQPGVFGWDKIDAGSALLVDHLPKDLKGVAADFGAGTGYLSKHLLERCPNITSIILAEADSRALECARENVASDKAEYLWADLTKPADLPVLDVIVMNPPFHTGKKTESQLGQSFIETAAHHLKKGGKLYMVANAHLPYEHILHAKFSEVKLLAEKQGFKIFEARK